LILFFLKRNNGKPIIKKVKNGGTMKIVKLITKATHQSIVDAMISIAIAHGLTITNVEDIMTDVIAYLKDHATVKK
jgi:hypothetical protein